MYLDVRRFRLVVVIVTVLAMAVSLAFIPGSFGKRSLFAAIMAVAGTTVYLIVTRMTTLLKK